MTRFLELSIGRMIVLKGNKAPGAQFPLSPSPQPAIFPQVRSTSLYNATAFHAYVKDYTRYVTPRLRVAMRDN